MAGAAAVSVMQDALRRDLADAAARQAQASVHFERFMACLCGPTPSAQAPR